jgi:WD40 repeat protein
VRPGTARTRRTSVRPLVVNDRQTPASISVSPDGRQMSVVSAAHPAEIWDVASGVQVGTIKVPVGTSSAHFVSDDEWVSTTTDGAVTIHDLNVTDWIGLACRAAGRELTPLEWQQFLPTYPYQAVCADGSPAKEAS